MAALALLDKEANVDRLCDQLDRLSERFTEASTRDRVDALSRLLREHRAGAQRVAAWQRDTLLGVPAAAGGETVTAFARLFDALARQNQETSVALYSLGDPQILAHATSEIVEFLRSAQTLHPARRALDIGCGIGRLLVALAPELGSIVGIDISAVMIETASHRAMGLDNVRIRRTDGYDLRVFPDAEFDLVLAIDSWPFVVHAGPSLVDAHFAEVARVLRPGGDFVIMNYSYRWDRVLDISEVRGLAERCGLGIIEEGVTPFSLWDGVVWLLRRGV